MKNRTLISRKKVKKLGKSEVKKAESYSLDSKSIDEIPFNGQPPPTQSSILTPTIYDFSTKDKNNSYIIEDEEESYKMPQYKNFEPEIRND